MKRILALIMAVIMFAAVLCGCGNEASGAASDNGNLVSATELLRRAATVAAAIR